MRIAPNTTGWNNGEYEWSFVEDPSSAIANGAQREGLTVPPEYLNFMLKFNGGKIYPRLFMTSIPEEILPGAEGVRGRESFAGTALRVLKHK